MYFFLWILWVFFYFFFIFWFKYSSVSKRNTLRLRHIDGFRYSVVLSIVIFFILIIFYFLFFALLFILLLLKKIILIHLQDLHKIGIACYIWQLLADVLNTKWLRYIYFGVCICVYVVNVWDDVPIINLCICTRQQSASLGDIDINGLTVLLHCRWFLQYITKLNCLRRVDVYNSLFMYFVISFAVSLFTIHAIKVVSKNFTLTTSNFEGWIKILLEHQTS